MSGWKMFREMAILFGMLLLGVAVGEALVNYFDLDQPKAEPFKPMELVCVDTEGKAATKDNTLRYYRDGSTIVGYDEQGMFYVYTPPRGWVCRFGEVKKP